MTSLHKVAEISKKVIIGFAIGIVSIIFFAVLFRIFGNIKEALFPTPPPPPTVLFGKLPDIPFPQSNVAKSLSYNLNTVTGKLPDLPFELPVYQVMQPQANLLSFDNIKQLVAKNTFTGSPVALSDTLYQWQNNDPISTKLIFNILTSDFSISSNYIADQNVLSANYLPQNTQEAIDFAKNFLINFSSFPADVDPSKTTTTLLSIQNGVVVPATSFSSAQLIAVDFYQNNLGDYSLFYPNYPASTMHIVIGSGANIPVVVAALFNHKIIATEQSATYPLKTAAAAFAQLKANNAYVASYTGTNNAVTIRDISVGYYVGENPQKFAYPIVVFQGDNNFTAYVNAIANEWISK